VYVGVLCFLGLHIKSIYFPAPFLGKARNLRVFGVVSWQMSHCLSEVSAAYMGMEYTQVQANQWSKQLADVEP
jgi:hypothetical protein